VTVDHVYVHVPFCARRCSYCDFAIAVRRVVPVADFLAALAREAAHHRAPRTRARCTSAAAPVAPGRGRCRGAGAALRRGGGAGRVHGGGEPRDVTAERSRLGACRREPPLDRRAVVRARVLAWMHRTHDAAGIGRAVRTRAREASRTSRWTSSTRSPTRWSATGSATSTRRSPSRRSTSRCTGSPSSRTRRCAAGSRVRGRRGGRRPVRRRVPDGARAARVRRVRVLRVSNAALPGREAIHNAAYWRRRLSRPRSLAHSFDGTDRWWNERSTSAGWPGSRSGRGGVGPGDVDAGAAAPGTPLPRPA